MTRSLRDCVEHFPLSMFGLVMGLTGLGLGWRAWGAQVGIEWAGEPVLMVSWLVFFFLAFLFIFKAVRHPAEMIIDLRHPVRLNYLAAVSISMVLMSIVLQPHEPLPARGVFLLGAGLHLIITVLVVNFWMHHARFAITQVNPAWFIPAVGNVLIPFVTSRAFRGSSSRPIQGETAVGVPRCRRGGSPLAQHGTWALSADG